MSMVMRWIKSTPRSKASAVGWELLGLAGALVVGLVALAVVAVVVLAVV